MKEVQTRVETLFSLPRIATYLLHDLLPDVLVALLVFLAFYLGWRLLDRGAQAVLGRLHLDTTARSFLLSVLRYVLMSVAVVLSLEQLGIDTASLVTSLGIAGLTIGFAAKDALSNIISGLFIFWDRPFVVGDLVEIAGHYGRVAEITMRSTRVVTPDGRMLAIPNAQVVNTVVASYTNFPHLRLDIALSVGVEENLDRVRSVLLQLVGEDDRFLSEPAPRVVVTALDDYKIDLELQVWLHDEFEHLSARFELRKACFEVLRSAGVDMPFETLTLRLQRAQADTRG